MIEECPLPKHYIWYAKESNRAAEFLLQPNNEVLNSASFAISIGLSFHAIELCGKAMLRSLGDLQNKISKEHSKHELLNLLESVEQRLSIHSDAKAQGVKDFLLYEPVVNGKRLGETIKSYLQTHLSSKKEARPRNYLYPDNETFIGPKSISTIHVIAEHIIESAIELCSILGHEVP